MVAPIRMIVTSEQIEAMIEELATRHGGNKSAAIRQAILEAWQRMKAKEAQGE
ncbi:MAG: hypothetical protein V1755_02705 [Chloroflexota bacterium]